MTTRVIAVALGVVIAIAALASASAQQEPPYRYYGHDATAGDVIAAHDEMGAELGSMTVDSNGSWYIDVDRDKAEGVSFTVNGKAADANTTPAGQGQSSVVLTVAMMEDSDEDSMSEGDEDSMTDEGDELSGDDGMEELEGEDTSMSDDKMDGGKTDFPDTGSGGLADGGVSAGLIGLLIALGVAAVAGLGLRRVRNRA